MEQPAGRPLSCTAFRASGQEVTDEVLDGPTSACCSNRKIGMYVQKAILHALFT